MDLQLPKSEYPRVVIIGGGFGGIELAKRLKNKPFQVVMLDKHNYHTFQPLLYQVATGGLEPDSIAFPLRKIFRAQKNFIFRVTKVTDVLASENALLTDIGKINYDYLVIATGSTSNFFGNKEIEENSMPMKSIPEALDLRSMILQNFEKSLIEKDADKKSALLNFVVVGGGPTGVETAGAIAELKRHVVPNDYPELDLNKVHIYLIENSPELLGVMSVQAQTKAKDFLVEMGVNVMNSTRVLGYDGHTLTLQDKPIILTSSVIWSAGVKGEVIPGLDLAEIVRGGRLKTDQQNLIVGYPNIYAIGDVAAIITEATPNGHPGVAPAAIQQGNLLAKNLVNLVSNKPLENFKYFDKGSMATVGRNKAVVDIGKIRFQGVFAWFTWMFVHLMTLVGFRNKIIVFINWVWSYFSYDRGARLIIRTFAKDRSIDYQTDDVASVKEVKTL
ncbi:NAD(P)/FAD-dependent oxidoreductase [Pedobacter changchengzhani]|uniref:NADH:ubiquinone reductase (non-electrogenic) n=1 Tax=Pedobacter changchengzhani TaxID=2529274 RepID=A0A4R5MLL6_9SPHI|nr:NAD(P)/FAD-dependent oxidoreductase [Pedobacter changchengzhani]TDG36584.1 NAD(P)/FAD-dependent oxidoreductase [Pedobacter changchengzhani]